MQHRYQRVKLTAEVEKSAVDKFNGRLEGIENS